jgi:hypothetical protein
VGGSDNIHLLFRCQILRSGFDGDIEEFFLLDRGPRHRHLPLAVKHIGNAAARREVALIFAENATDLGGCPVLVVRGSLNDDRHAPWPIPFVDNLVKVLGLCSFTGASLDRPLDIVIGHALAPGRLDGAAQTRIPGRIAAPEFRRDTDLLGELAEDLPPLGVQSPFEALNFRPLAVPGHDECSACVVSAEFCLPEDG